MSKEEEEALIPAGRRLVAQRFLLGFQSNMWKKVPTQPPTLGDCALTWFNEGVLCNSVNSFLAMFPP
jgi:hypothetical protein